MLLPGRHANTSDYRYAFNGKETDNEIKGEGLQYDYGFRVYDPRLGKFLSVDPLFKGYPWYTPYQFAGNKPIVADDLDGLEERIRVFWPHSDTEPVTDIAVNDPYGYGKGTLDMYVELVKFRTSEQTGVDDTHRYYKAHVYYDITYSHFDMSQYESRGSGSFYEDSGLTGTVSEKRGLWDRWALGQDHKPGGVRDVSLQLAAGELVAVSVLRSAKALGKSVIKNGKAVVQGGTPKASPNVTSPSLQSVSQLEKEQMANAVGAGKSSSGANLSEGKMIFSQKASDAIFEMGSYASHVSIKDGVAKIRIGFTKSVTKENMNLVEETLKSNGANSVQIMTGTVKPKIKVLFNKLRDAGKTYRGYKIEKSLNPLHDFKLTKKLN